MSCVPWRDKWLHSISVEKVHPESRDKIACYQKERDDILYEYGTNGRAKKFARKQGLKRVLDYVMK
ncbi:phage antirepressor N-terminal domain-containing protein [Pantoea sp. KPR_PJ]|uniref:phage antirepressor N-terminal domain-containing protein n=1 Tax=Pantoea sp. KPR_PJ TaxID=2738375 RepID=UPI0035273A06